MRFMHAINCMDDSDIRWYGNLYHEIINDNIYLRKNVPSKRKLFSFIHIFVNQITHISLR